MNFGELFYVQMTVSDLDDEVSIYNNFLYTIELANKLYDFDYLQKKNPNNNS